LALRVQCTSKSYEKPQHFTKKSFQTMLFVF
jgi:hypothetical protein